MMLTPAGHAAAKAKFRERYGTAAQAASPVVITAADSEHVGITAARCRTLDEGGDFFATIVTCGFCSLCLHRAQIGVDDVIRPVAEDRRQAALLCTPWEDILRAAHERHRVTGAGIEVDLDDCHRPGTP